MSSREGLPGIWGLYPQARAAGRPGPCLTAWGRNHPLVDPPRLAPIAGRPSGNAPTATGTHHRLSQ
jgi:hypothetical protein